MKALALLLLLSVSAAESASPPVRECCVDIAMTVERAASSGVSTHLAVHLTNKSPATVTTYSASLPWGNRHSIILAAIRESRPNEPLTMTVPIDDPGPGTVDIKPSQTVQGDIDLDYFFADLPKVLKSDSVIVFWTYKLSTLDRRESQRVGGWIRLAQYSVRP